MKVPSFTEMRNSVNQSISSLKDYSVSFKLPNMKKSVAVGTVIGSSVIAPEADRVQKLYKGTVFKGAIAALGTLASGAVCLGSMMLLMSNPIGLGILVIGTVALAVALFVLGSTANVSKQLPPLPVEVVAPPAPRTWPGYFMSFVGY